MRKALALIILMGNVCAAAQTSNTSLSEQIAADLAQARAGITPAAWLQAHPDEKLQMFNGSQFANDTKDWCARTVVTHTSAAGRVWTRTVYFYDPVPPPDDALPPIGAPKEEILRTTCQLGLMCIQFPEINVSTGTQLVREIEAALHSRYGSGTVPSLPGGFGSVGWIETRQWQVGDAVLTAAYDDFRGKGTRVLVRLAFPVSDAIHDLKKDTEQAHLDLLAQRDDLVRRIQQTGLTAGPTAKMIALLESPDYFSGNNLPSGNRVAEALGDWLTAAKAYSPGQQAIRPPAYN